jgi:DNA/RNA endonuclease YhcR with UshA esterase domain
MSGRRRPSKERFTGWIPKDSALAGDPSLSSLEGKTVKVTGKIDLYHGKPEIKIVSGDQLVSE